jgi:hypothetical protein
MQSAHHTTSGTKIRKKRLAIERDHRQQIHLARLRMATRAQAVRRGFGWHCVWDYLQRC